MTKMLNKTNVGRMDMDIRMAGLMYRAHGSTCMNECLLMTAKGPSAGTFSQT